MPEGTVAEILSRVRTALADSPIHELRSIQVESSQDAFILSGRVSSYYHKQLAQELVRQFSHRIGFELINRIEVSEHQEPTSGSF